MCFSASVETDIKRYRTAFGVRTDMIPVKEIFERRAKGEKIEIPRAFEANFAHPHSAEEKKIDHLIHEFRARQQAELEAKLFEQKKKLADAERKLAAKPTKTAENAKATAGRQIERIRSRMERMKGKLTESDSRVYAFQWAPLILWDKGGRRVELQRYHLRPFGMKEEFDRKYPGCYNARRDSLTGFWRKEFGHKHGVLVIKGFYENVKKHDYENRKLKAGEAEENMVLEFRPEGHEYMFVPCIWDEWKDKDGTILRSFALITDEPPPEIAATGHDRCPVFLKEENIDAWLQPSGKSDKELFAILDDRMRPKYRHALAA
jgi:putative SOS response-associated peptidase YedK